MFPPAGSEVYYNEANEPLGWDQPASAEDLYCDAHGFSHAATCEEVDGYYDNKGVE